MPHFDNSPFPCRYNSLRLLGYDYSSTLRLCAITLVTELRRPVFADMQLAKHVLACLLSDETRKQMLVRAFTLMPDHLHLLASVRQPEFDLRNVIGKFKSFSTQLYWKRSREIVSSEQLSLPSLSVNKSNLEETKPLLRALPIGRQQYALRSYISKTGHHLSLHSSLPSICGNRDFSTT